MGKLIAGILGVDTYIWLIAIAGLSVLLGLQTLRLAHEQTENAELTSSYNLERLKAEQERGKQVGLVLTLERKLQTLTTEPETKNADNAEKVRVANAALGAERQRNGGRMRDPWQEADCQRAGPAVEARPGAGNRAEDTASPGRLLSAELTRRLDERAAQADAINLAYDACRADALNLRAAREAAGFSQ